RVYLALDATGVVHALQLTPSHVGASPQSHRRRDRVRVYSDRVSHVRTKQADRVGQNAGLFEGREQVARLMLRTLHHFGVRAISCRRSEERRVGKECRSRWGPSHGKKKVIEQWSHVVVA